MNDPGRARLYHALLAAAFAAGLAAVGCVAASMPDFHFPMPETAPYELRETEAPGEAAVARKVNINTADAAQLEALPGIGPKTARAIVDYRDAHGRFRRRGDLMKVKGIGEKTYEKLKDQITL